MSNVAIVGVEQSGKTALMISWGWHYFSPDRNGYYLSPDPNGGGVTRDLICEEMNRMKNGKWPDATSPDAVKKLNWILGRNGKALGEMSFIDFGGEIYRKAFKDGPDATMALKKDPRKNKSYHDNTPESKAILQLQWHIRSCNALVILVDLGYIINNPPLTEKRTREMIATIQCMMEIMRRRGLLNSVALAFSQADLYESTLKKHGNLRNVLQDFLPEIAAHYPKTALFSVSAVNRTIPDDDGLPIPAPNFKAEGLELLTKWVVRQMLRLHRIRILALSCVIAVMISLLCVSAVVNVERERESMAERRQEMEECQRREEANRRVDEERRELNNRIRRLADEVDVRLNNAGTEIAQNDFSTAKTLIDEAEERVDKITKLDVGCDWSWVAQRRTAIKHLRDQMAFIECQRNISVPQHNFYPVMY